MVFSSYNRSDGPAKSAGFIKSDLRNLLGSDLKSNE